jgi:hypothetical protein
MADEQNHCDKLDDANRKEIEMDIKASILPKKS